MIVLFQWDPGSSRGAGRKIARLISDQTGLHVKIKMRVTAMKKFIISSVSDIFNIC